MYWTRCLLTAVVAILYSGLAKADLFYHYTGSSGPHSVDVIFGIEGVDSPFQLIEGQSYPSFYDATYTTTSGDPGFDVADSFSGLGMVVPGSSSIPFVFPQNPLPNGNATTRVEFGKRGGGLLWVLSPPTFFESVVFTQLSSDPRIPEPTTFTLVACGLIGFGACRRR